MLYGGNNIQFNTIGTPKQGGFPNEVEPALISELFYYGKPVVEQRRLPLDTASDSIYPLVKQAKTLIEESLAPKTRGSGLDASLCPNMPSENYLTIDGRWVYKMGKTSARSREGGLKIRNALMKGFCLPPGGEYSGKGVLVSTYVLPQGKKMAIWPKEIYQYPAGDYPARLLPLDADEELKKLLPMNTLIVPSGWKVRVFDESKQGRPHQDISGPMILKGSDILSNTSNYSMIVRGPWSLADYQNSQKLKSKMTGWITRNWPQEPAEEDITALILMDPNRTISSDLNSPVDTYEAYWGPGWEQKIPKVVEVYKKVLNSNTTSGVMPNPGVVSGLRPTTTETINTAASMAAPIVDAFLPGVGTAISSLLPIVTGFFTDQPCDPNAAPECAIDRYWDGRVQIRDYMECCNPNPSGMGVLLTEHQPGYKYWPSKFREIPAGDYWSLSTETVEEEFGPDFPSAGFKESELSGIVVPQNWAVQIFTGRGFTGQGVELGAGVHKLHELGFGDKIASMKVRGPWTWYDWIAGRELMKQRPGWITFNMPTKPDKNTVLQLVLGDPNRVIPMTFSEPVIPWEPFWSPGWNYKLKYLKAAAEADPETREKVAQKKASAEIVQKQQARQQTAQQQFQPGIWQ